MSHLLFRNNLRNTRLPPFFGGVGSGDGFGFFLLIICRSRARRAELHGRTSFFPFGEPLSTGVSVISS